MSGPSNICIFRKSLNTSGEQYVPTCLQSLLHFVLTLNLHNFNITDKLTIERIKLDNICENYLNIEPGTKAHTEAV